MSKHEYFFPAPDETPPNPPSPLWVPAITALCVLSILLPPGAPRLSLGVVLLSFFFYVFFWTREISINGFSFGFQFSFLMARWIDLVGFHQPERDFWRVEEAKDGAMVNVYAPDSKWKKLGWFVRVWFAQRGVGHNFVNNKTPPSPPKSTTRGQFLRTSIPRLIRLFLVTDIFQIIILYCIRLKNRHSFYSLSLQHQVVFAWAVAFWSYASMEFSYLLISTIAVGSGFSQASSWPALFGSFAKDGYTIRKIWGTCWHQVLRRSCAQAGIAVKNLLGLRTGGFASRYTQVWVAFMVSAVLHYIPARMSLFEDGGYDVVCFFMLQPVGIMVEDFIIWVGGRLGIRENGLTKMLGFLWVFVWFSWTVRFVASFHPDVIWEANPKGPIGVVLDLMPMPWLKK